MAINQDKVKALAAQATAWCEQYAEGTPVAWEWENKFAELIVQECTYQINSIMDYTDYDDPELARVELKALRDARQVIKEHFGLANRTQER